MKIIFLIIALVALFSLLRLIARNKKKTKGSIPDDNYPMW